MNIIRRSRIEKMSFAVREFIPERDTAAAEALEQSCEVGPSGKTSLITDLLGDPLARVRNSPEYLMLVAETEEKEIIGLIRGCIKFASCGQKFVLISSGSVASSEFVKLAYILGLRVSPSHRRMGVGKELVLCIEEWFRSKGAEYAYMATEKDNEASVKLFTGVCGYKKFRVPSILVHPVFRHNLSLNVHRQRRDISILKLSMVDAVKLYTRYFSSVEFFPQDIDNIVHNPLSLGTYLAIFSNEQTTSNSGSVGSFFENPPESWAVVSVWNSKEVYNLQIRGVSKLNRSLAKASRLIDGLLTRLKIPSFPNLFKPFGFLFLYGIGGEGPRAAELVKVLCRHAHNMARGAGGCSAVAAEIGACDPLRKGIPYWSKLSCPEDLWCIKRLSGDYNDGSVGDWTKAPPQRSIFIDPREV